MLLPQGLCQRRLAAAVLGPTAVWGVHQIAAVECQLFTAIQTQQYVCCLLLNGLSSQGLGQAALRWSGAPGHFPVSVAGLKLYSSSAHSDMQVYV